MSVEVDFRGNFEVHLTVRAVGEQAFRAVESYAVQRDMKFTHIVLARGRVADQPMLTLQSTGDLAAVTEVAQAAARELRAAGVPVIRTKIELSPWGRGVPATDKQGRARGAGQYFEHHVKLLLATELDPDTVAEACAGHNAHVSANARRTRTDGRTERFVTQRCRTMGDSSAGNRLDLLLRALRERDFEVLSVEREFVVYDSDESVDDGWLAEDAVAMPPTQWENFRHGPWPDEHQRVPNHPPTELARANRMLPATLLPVDASGVSQRPVFDPAFTDRRFGMRLSEPYFDEDDVAGAWRRARREALDHVLAGLAATQWADQVMVRGSVLLRAWYGTEAREPGDLDFVVLSPDWTLPDPRTEAMFVEVAAVAQGAAERSGSTVRLDPAGAVSDEIWTYDRVPGRRLVLPWSATEPGIPGGSVQLDFVFGEALPEPPLRTEIARLGSSGPGAVLLAASPQLSLAWKLVWLATDCFPEGKDLFDAVLLAERVTMSQELFRAAAAGEAVEAGFADGAAWAREASWSEFTKDYPHLADEHDTYVWRLASALAAMLPDGFSTAYTDLAGRITSDKDKLGNVYTKDGLPGLAREMDRFPSPTLFRLVTLREVVGRDNCTLSEAADLLAQLPIPEDSELPTRVDPHMIAAALSTDSNLGH
ncbi:nucleotidyl transferase AbiEii/AbiGii toxin family protein [Nocardia sp. NPDC058480]|uniref:nucleotidyl transferase AbiEii/AbiGii toxin family protein n=1 Tax=Nocardia sp. NPDC058480 TaxID=3346522 RepID=UPI00365B02E8